MLFCIPMSNTWECPRPTFETKFLSYHLKNIVYYLKKAKKRSWNRQASSGGLYWESWEMEAVEKKLRNSPVYLLSKTLIWYLKPVWKRYIFQQMLLTKWLNIWREKVVRQQLQIVLFRQTLNRSTPDGNNWRAWIKRKK